MRYIALDFGNSNTSVAVLEPPAGQPGQRFQPRVLTHDRIAFHYDPGLPHTLIPSCIDPASGRIGREALTAGAPVRNIKRQLKTEAPNAEDIEHAARFIRALFKALNLQIGPEDRLALTIPSVGRADGEAAYQQTLKQVLARAFDDFPALDAAGVFHFCAEALASAVSYRTFQNPGAREVVCLDIGNYSADATYFETTHAQQVYAGQPLGSDTNGRETAGGDVDGWVQAHARTQGLEVSLPDCASAKERVSRREDLKAGDSPLAGILNGPILDQVLKDHQFHAVLADLIWSVLPEPLSGDEDCLSKVRFLFTGGSSTFPELADGVLGTLWQRHFPNSRRTSLPAALCYRPFDACVTGAAWWLWLCDGERHHIPVLDRDHALVLYEPRGAGLRRARQLFVARGQDLGAGLALHYDLVPADPEQDRYRIEILAYDEHGGSQPLPPIEGPLVNETLRLDLHLAPTGTLRPFIDGVEQASLDLL